jgi:hypothetical protein
MSASKKQEANRQRHARRRNQRQNKIVSVNVPPNKIGLTECMLGKYFMMNMFDINAICSLICCCRNFHEIFVSLLLSLGFLSMMHAKRYKDEYKKYVENVFDVTDTNDLMRFDEIL